MPIRIHTPLGYVHHPYRPEDPWSLSSPSSPALIPLPVSAEEEGVYESTRATTRAQSEEEWLQTNTDNPYIEISAAMLVNLLPAMSIWIKYRKHSGERRQGGLLSYNGAPNYIKLYNRYTRKSFSVQVQQNTLYARRNALELYFPRAASSFPI